MRGGYVMIDCTGLDILTASGQTIHGLYKEMKKAYATNKPVMAVNCNWGDEIATPMNVLLLPDVAGTDVMSASFATLRIDVTKQDAVTVTNYIQ